MLTLAIFRSIHINGTRHLFKQETAFLSFICTLTAIDSLAGFSTRTKLTRLAIR
jgi:hypothetical protein